MRGDMEYLDGVLDELEAVVRDASGVPLRKGRAVLDRTDFLVLLEELREALPADIEEAERIRGECEAVVAEAGEEARRIGEQAEERAESRMEETEFYRRSQREAKEVVEQAGRYAEEVRGGAEDYRDQVMDQLEGWFESSLHSVEQSRRELGEPQARKTPRRESDSGDDGQGWQANSA